MGEAQIAHLTRLAAEAPHQWPAGRSATRSVAFLLLLAAALFGSALPARAIEAVYSSIAEEDCTPTASLALGERVIRSSEDGTIFACAGPPGHRLHVVDDGTRSWYALERDGRVHSLENDIVYEFRHGNFPNVPSTGMVEWGLTSSGEVAGLIFRIAYQRQTQSGPEQASTLLVYNLEGDEPRFLGYADSNSEARRLLEDSLS